MRTLILYLILVCLWTACTLDDEEKVQATSEDSEVETRSGVKLPVFYSGSFTTNSFLITNQPNVQYAFNKDSVAFAKLVRVEGEVVNFAGTILGIYEVTVVFTGGNTIQDIYFARDSIDNYLLYPSGATQIKGYNYAQVIRMPEQEEYYDFTYLKDKKRHLYKINLDGNMKTNYINANSNNGTVYSFNHQL